MPHKPAATLRFVVVAWIVLGPVCSALAQPSAADTPAPAASITIVHIDGDDIVIDAGAAQLEHVQRLTVYRSLEVRHPITRKSLRDRFALGTLAIVQAGSRLSIARVQGVPSHPVAVGDSVELLASGVAEPAGTNATQIQSAPAATNASQAAGVRRSSAVDSGGVAQQPGAMLRAPDTEERELLAYWYATLAKDPDARVRLYQAFLLRHPGSRYRSYVQAEINYLNASEQTVRRVAQASAASIASTASIRVHMAARSHALAGEPVELAALVDKTPEFRSLLVHVRTLLEPRVSQTLLAEIDDSGHARVTVPASFVHPPGFGYFIETVDIQGHAASALATPEQPEIVRIEAPTPRPSPGGPSTRVHYTSELVSFDDLNGRDWFLLNEGDFLYRLRRPMLYALRLGYGNYRGEGGTVDELDRLQRSPKPAGFSYGFVELQFELHRLFGLALRGTVGLGRPSDPNEERNGITGGFQMRARIGDAESAHLELAGELLPEIGQRAYIGLHWEAIRRLPMATEVVVTDQPVHSDELAVRLVYELGFRVSDRIAVALRPSYQLRTIRHAGPGLGLSTTFDW